MNYPVQTDVLPFLLNLVQCCRPFAGAQSVSLVFETDLMSLVVPYHPEEVASDLVQLICRIVTFTPQNQQVTVRVSEVKTPGQYFIKIEIENSGVNLSRIGEIAAQLKNPCIVHAEQEGKTLYELQWRLNRPAETEAPSPVFKGHPPDNVRHYYDEIRRRMSRVFSKKESLHDALFKKNPQDAIFLQKTDAIVQAHIADEDFDTGYLAKALAMSRMSLHRKLKTITGKAPADYIRQLRLEKAKQLIEASDSTIGEVSFQVGFQSQSHFTRAFVSHFGVRPTAYKKGK